MKLLIVDDSRVMRQIVVRTLRQAGLTGHEVVQADNGRTGFEAVVRHRPQLVLSEWHMPEATGLDLLLALRAGGHAVPFVFVTSERSSGMVAKAEKAGAMSVIAKPLTPERLRDALGPVLG